jgi:hypothetical protein
MGQCSPLHSPQFNERDLRPWDEAQYFLHMAQVQMEKGMLPDADRLLRVRGAG